jgi:hypothetical protein
MTENDIKNLFSGIYESILEAQMEVEERFARNVVQTYFNADGTPKMVSLNIQGQKMEIPVLSLIPLSNLKIAEVSLDIKVKIADKNEKSFHKLFFDPQKNNAHLSIKFKETETPEGLAKINNQLIQFIQ